MHGSFNNPMMFLALGLCAALSGVACSQSSDNAPSVAKSAQDEAGCGAENGVWYEGQCVFGVVTVTPDDDPPLDTGNDCFADNSCWGPPPDDDPGNDPGPVDPPQVDPEPDPGICSWFDTSFKNTKDWPDEEPTTACETACKMAEHDAIQDCEDSGYSAKNTDRLCYAAPDKTAETKTSRAKLLPWDGSPTPLYSCSCTVTVPCHYVDK